MGIFYISIFVLSLHLYEILVLILLHNHWCFRLAERNVYKWCLGFLYKPSPFHPTSCLFLLPAESFYWYIIDYKVFICVFILHSGFFSEDNFHKFHKSIAIWEYFTLKVFTSGINKIALFGSSKVDICVKKPIWSHSNATIVSRY